MTYNQAVVGLHSFLLSVFLSAKQKRRVHCSSQRCLFLGKSLWCYLGPWSTSALRGNYPRYVTQIGAIKERSRQWATEYLIVDVYIKWASNGLDCSLHKLCCDQRDGRKTFTTTLCANGKLAKCWSNYCTTKNYYTVSIILTWTKTHVCLHVTT